jgi:RNA polymerase I-specific transcription initiation factor RRN7
MMLVEIYTSVQNLQKVVDFTYRFPIASTKRDKCLAFPEAQMVALVIVAAKLISPFDELKRYPTSAQDPAVQVIDWGHWARVQKEFDERATEDGRAGKAEEILVTERDVLDMTKDQLDKYMDWYENNWLDSRGTETRPGPPFSPLGLIVEFIISDFISV